MLCETEDRVGICKLCQETRKLCRSHIVPEFLYKPGYDEKHRTYELQLGPAKRLYRQKGYRERLLCEPCEQFLNDEYEKPFKEAWYDNGLQPQPPLPKIIMLEGLDYGSFKLFHLSVLWRASVASDGGLYSAADLGPHEDTLRQMILKQDPRRPGEYGLFCRALVLKDQIADGIITDPVYFKYEGARLWMHMYGGCEWNILTASHVPPGFEKITISEEGKLPVMRVDLLEHEVYRNYMEDFLRRSGER